MKSSARLLLTRRALLDPPRISLTARSLSTVSSPVNSKRSPSTSKPSQPQRYPLHPLRPQSPAKSARPYKPWKSFKPPYFDTQYERSNVRPKKLRPKKPPFRRSFEVTSPPCKSEQRSMEKLLKEFIAATKSKPSKRYRDGTNADELQSRTEGSSQETPGRKLLRMDPTLLAKKLIAITSPPPSQEDRDLPPHHVPYLRQEEGYIRDLENAEQVGTSSVLRDTPSPSQHKPIAQLEHGLDRVLFNPGVHWLQDPRSKVYNFTPWLQTIPKVTDFDFDRVRGFVPSSMDNDLFALAKQHGRMFTGSTSSLTGLLSHIYFLISADKPVDTSSLTPSFSNHAKTFTPGQRMPASVIFHYKEGVWAADADKAQDLADKNVLTWMGTMLENFLTLPETDFKKLLRSAPPLGPDTDGRREAYRYAMSEQFMMRSQLDCYDPRLPGNGIFDIKTRAAVPIRLDVLNYEENSGYLIKTLTGPLESFEKEYYDLIRSAFLKYSFQARIGNMDGVLIAYHNTARIFGFQYVSLEEMEQKLYRSGNGARVFDKCVLLLEKVLMDVVPIYGQRSVRCMFETRQHTNELTIWVEPVMWDARLEGKPRPIKELRVRVSSFMNGALVSGWRAVESADDDEWVIRWTITEGAFEEDEMRARLAAARQRQLVELNFPTGVSTTEEMRLLWDSIDYGGERPNTSVSTLSSLERDPKLMRSLVEAMESDEEVVELELGSDPVSSATFSSHSKSVPPFNFRHPDSSILRLRQLALEGREETMREEAEKRAKVVLGAAERSPREEKEGSMERLPGDGDGVGKAEVAEPSVGVDGELVRGVAEEMVDGVDGQSRR